MAWLRPGLLLVSEPAGLLVNDQVGRSMVGLKTGWFADGQFEGFVSHIAGSERFVCLG